ncbi:MAG TPA: DUF2254 domain-containing protein [Pilimelia sp.]|nr:DUF2254 domain-containing protein [Pilimelia sp.]
MTRPNGGVRSRWQAASDVLRTQLWPVPVAAIVAAVALGVALPELDARLVHRLPDRLTGYLFGGGPESARSVLQAVAGSLITVTSLTFSLTVVTLQLASSQYSPRLLRTFARDRMVHATLAVLLGTFTFALAVLRTVRTEFDADPAFVPRLSVTAASLLALVSVVALVAFLAHLARQIRVESMLRDVHAESSATIRRVLAVRPPDRAQEPVALPPGPGTPVCGTRSGFLTSVDERRLLAAAQDADALVRIDRVPGDSLVAGTPVATAWARRGGPVDDDTRATLTERIAGAVRTGFERTSGQDVAFGLRQLVDVAVKALSPAVNDPTTAVHALGHAAALLVEAAGRDLGPRLLRDGAGQVRVVLCRPDLPALLRLAVDQPLRYGVGDPQVLARLLMLLREVAWVARDDGQRRAVTDQLARVRAQLDRHGPDEPVRHELHALADRVAEALHGRWPHGDEHRLAMTR